MNRFLIAVCCSAMILTMVNPIPVGTADGPLRRMGRGLFFPNRTVTRSSYNQRWTVAGGNSNVSYHLQNWPHNINTYGMNQSRMLQVHDHEHDVIGPVNLSYSQVNRTVNRPNRIVTRQRVTSSICPTGNCPLPTVTYVQPVPTVTQICPTGVCPLPTRELTVAEVERKVQVAFNEAADGDTFHRSMVNAVRSARQNGSINGRQAVRIRVALMAPAFRAEAQALCMTQMAFSGEAGDIDQTAIDWESFGAFLEKIIPLIIDLLTRFGIGV